MNWKDELFRRLVREPLGGYGDEKSPACEPTALAAMALAAHGDIDAAEKGMDFLQGVQAADGSVGIRAGEPDPAWPTSLAILAWKLHPQADTKYRPQIDAAVEWTLQAQGLPIPKEQATELGHDTTLVGWSWAANTHSWIEPTILHVLSLKACGLNDHPRVREGIQLLIDRQLPGGGCNYGNTTVLGQTLRPHLQPSGMLLLALADEEDASGRKEKSIQYVVQSLDNSTTTASLNWSLLGLAAVGKTPSEAEAWMEHAYLRLHRTDSQYRLALLANAALGSESPFIRLVAAGVHG
jgi:hypothetical protein